MDPLLPDSFPVTTFLPSAIHPAPLFSTIHLLAGSHPWAPVILASSLTFTTWLLIQQSGCELAAGSQELSKGFQQWVGGMIQKILAPSSLTLCIRAPSVILHKVFKTTS